VPLLTSAEKSAQRRRLPTKTIVQQREADILSFPLFLCLIIWLLSALSETNFGRSVFFLSLSVMFFRGIATSKCPNILNIYIFRFWKRCYDGVFLWNSSQYQVGFSTGKNKITYSPHNSIVYISNHIGGLSFRILDQFWSALILRVIVCNGTIKIISKKPCQTQAQHHTCLGSTTWDIYEQCEWQQRAAFKQRCNLQLAATKTNNYLRDLLSVRAHRTRLIMLVVTSH